MATVKCQYCNEKLDKKDSILHETVSDTGNVYKKFFHKQCFQYYTDREKALVLFYEYTKCLEPRNKVYLAFKKIREKGLTDSDVLYTINYVIENKMTLNYPMGLIYYLDRAMKDKKKRTDAEIKKQEILNTPTKIKLVPIANDEPKEFKKDSMDISDLLEDF